MSNSRHMPIFNMKAVVRETGLKPDTLRAWERRYGMPDPQRTSGGHRLYSQYEIDMLKWFIERQDEGMSISYAVELWRQMEARGEDPLAGKVETTPEPVSPLSISGEIIGQMGEAWLKACLAFDEYGAQRVLAQAFAQYPVETVCFELLQKGLQHIGQGWYEGAVTVQQEHFTASLALRQLEALLAAEPPPTQDVRILVACPPQEQHTFSSLLIALMFRRRGWNALYLGANVPVAQLETAVHTVQPHLVILSAQMLTTAATTRQVAHLLAQLDVPLVFGGAVFNELLPARRAIPGHFLGPELHTVPRAAQELLKTRPPAPVPTPLTSAYQAALAHYVEQQGRIALSVQTRLSSAGDQLKQIEMVSQELDHNIVAALTLGDIDLLRAHLNWVWGLLVDRHRLVSGETLQLYLNAYAEAVETNLDERGEPVAQWFHRLQQSPDWLATNGFKR